MSRVKFYLSLLTAAALVGLSGHALVIADDKAKGGASEEMGADELEFLKKVELVNSAYELAKYGKAKQKPECLLAAARILVTKAKALELEDAKSDDDKGGDPRKDALAMLRTAESFRGPLQESVEMIANDIRMELEKIQKEEKATVRETRGDFDGVQTRSGTLTAGTANAKKIYKIKFRGGEKAIILVSNIRKVGDINLRVDDDRGNFVKSDLQKARDALVQWTPSKAAFFVITVEAKSGKNIDFKLTTN